jgi:clan AA aspartic protease
VINLGTFNVSIQIADLDSGEFVDIDALVDTGATYTSIPENTLDMLGIAKRETRAFELADDRVIEYPVGYATMRLAGREIIAMVVFAPEGTAPLLGATALGNAGFAVDAVHQRLIPVTALLK